MTQVPILMVLMLASETIHAWPWTTAEDCVKKHVPRAESDRGARIVRNACEDRYGKKRGNAAWADCVIDKVGAAKTDAAAMMLNGLCHQENPDPPQPPAKMTAEQEKRLNEMVVDYAIRHVQAKKICLYRYAGNDSLISACINQEMSK